MRLNPCHQQSALCSYLKALYDLAELHKETQYWYRDVSITAGQASQIVKQRLANLGPQSMSPALHSPCSNSTI